MALMALTGAAGAVDLACELGDQIDPKDTCEVNMFHNGLSGSLEVAGLLPVTDTGSLNFTGDGTLNVGGNIEVQPTTFEGGGQTSSARSDGTKGTDGNPAGSRTSDAKGKDLTLLVGGNIQIDGLVSTSSGKGGTGGRGNNASKGNACNGGSAGNGGAGGTLIVTGQGNADINGTVTARGGNDGTGRGGTRARSGDGNGGNGGTGGNRGAAGDVKIQVCGNFTTVNDDPENGDRIVSRGGNAGNGCQGGHRNDGDGSNGTAGANGNGGDGNDIEVTADTEITIADKVHAQGGKGAGAPLTRVEGNDGTISNNSTQTELIGLMNVGEADFDPDETINYEQAPVCNACPARGVASTSSLTKQPSVHRVEGLGLSSVKPIFFRTLRGLPA